MVDLSSIRPNPHIPISHSPTLLVSLQAAYGANGYLPIIPPNATLEYDLELISFNETPKPGGKKKT